MKYLNDYTQDKINDVIKSNGGFFAFSNKQFEENKKDNIKYCRLYSGLIVPKNKVKKILNSIDKITENGIKQDLKENSIKDIVFRDCANLELQFSYDGLNQIIDYLKYYPIKKDTIKKHYSEYITYCVENNLI